MLPGLTVPDILKRMSMPRRPGLTPGKTARLVKTAVIQLGAAHRRGQWAWPPTQVVDRDPAAPDRFRVLHSA